MIESCAVSIRPKLQVSNSFDSALTDARQEHMSKQATRRSIRRVRFHPQVLMQEILHFKNYTPTELAMSWYSETELSQIKMEVQDVLSNLHSLSDDLEQRTAICRGLDAFTQHGAKKRRQNKKAGWEAVLNRSYGSLYERVTNAECIAQSYRQATESSIQEALERAKDLNQTALRQLRKGHKLSHNWGKRLPSWIPTPKRPVHPIQLLMQRITC